MSDERFRLRVAVFAILRRGDEVLLVRRANTGWKDGFYDFPAGHIEGAESLRAALVREVKEEIGVVVAPENFRFVHLMHGLFGDRVEYLDVFFEVREWQGEPRIAEPDKHSDLKWVRLSEAPPPLTPATQAGWDGLVGEQAYSELGF